MVFLKQFDILVDCSYLKGCFIQRFCRKNVKLNVIAGIYQQDILFNLTLVEMYFNLVGY